MAAPDSERWLRASPYLDRALDLDGPDRDACLAALRTQDPEVAADVEALLDEYRVLSAEGFLENGAGALPGAPALAGVKMGAYTLVEPIGEGGMGSVWLASRSDGRFEGKAAVKLLNAALVGRTAGERFKQEGTILARLTHAHIARLIDAGMSSAGQPYLVLEHVDGRHIDQYCDDQALDVGARVHLFLDVLSAVAHAHANLIVHRDLKPSNVLVTKDGQVKLLDFGIAKLIEDGPAQQTTTQMTRAGAVLTPKYAAPEQVTGGPITTATDVYALGVLLYELLSGLHPTGLGHPTPARLVRAIVDTEPTRLSAAAPKRLRRALAGDLETIVSKALKKKPEERYGSVAEFADDLRRFEQHQPITARPDSISYRAAKFARRHRPSLSAAALTLAVVAGLIGYYTVQLANERDRARLQADKASKVSELLAGLLTGADPYRDPVGGEPTVRALLDLGAERIARDMKDQPELQAEMFNVIGRTYERMGLRDKALPLLEQALVLGRSSVGPEHQVVAQSLNNLGVLHRVLGNLVVAQPLLEESLAMRRRLFGAEHKDVAVTLVELARLLMDRGRRAEAEPLIRDALAVRRRIFGEEHRETATSKNELGLFLWDKGDMDGAEQMLRENLATSVNVLGLEHANVASAKANLALVLYAKGDLVTAETLLREALVLHRKNVGEAHPSYANTLHNLSAVVRDRGRLDEAYALIQEALRIGRAALKEGHPRLLNFEVNLAKVQLLRNDAVNAEVTLRHVLPLRQRANAPGDWRIAQVQSLLGAALMAQGRDVEAEPLMRDAAAVLKPVQGAQGKEEKANRERLASLGSRTHP